MLVASECWVGAHFSVGIKSGVGWVAVMGGEVGTGVGSNRVVKLLPLISCQAS